MNKITLFLPIMVIATGCLSLRAEILEVHAFTNLNRSIPDGNASGLSDVRIISSTLANLSSVRIKLRVAGEFNGDLYGYLRHIQGAVTNFCVLLNRPGRSTANSAGYPDSGLNVLFDDTIAQGDIHLYRSLTNLPNGMQLTGTWQSDGRKVDPGVVLDTTARTTTLTNFNGTDASGEWTLFLADLVSGGTNMLVSWELDFTGIARPPVTWAAPANIIYGTSLGPSQLNASSPVAGSFSYTPAAGTFLNSGSNQLLTVMFTPNDSSSYLPVTTNVSINVLKKGLTITALSTNKVYGETMPAFSASYNGFVNNDAPVNLTTQPTLTTTALVFSPAGTYPITASDAAASNYVIDYVPGTLTIFPANTVGSLSSSANPSLPGQPVTFRLDLTAVPPGAGTPTGTVQFKIDGTNIGPQVSLSGGSAVLTANPAHGLHTITVDYTGEVNFNGTSNSLSPNQLVNTPPVPGPDNIFRDPTTGASVAITALLTNDIDADGDLLTFLSADAISANGSTIINNAGWLSYTPAVGFTNDDIFSYTISDGWGGAVTGSVSVIVRTNNGPPPTLSITSLGGGKFLIRGAGVPDRSYRILYSDFTPTNWQNLGQAMSDPTGAFLLTNSAATATRFYRSIYP